VFALGTSPGVLVVHTVLNRVFRVGHTLRCLGTEVVPTGALGTDPNGRILLLAMGSGGGDTDTSLGWRQMSFSLKKVQFVLKESL
jgi:hypothetical protein